MNKKWSNLVGPKFWSIHREQTRQPIDRVDLVIRDVRINYSLSKSKGIYQVNLISSITVKYGAHLERDFLYKPAI